MPYRSYVAWRPMRPIHRSSAPLVRSSNINIYCVQVGEMDVMIYSRSPASLPHDHDGQTECHGAREGGCEQLPLGETREFIPSLGLDLELKTEMPSGRPPSGILNLPIHNLLTRARLLYQIFIVRVHCGQLNRRKEKVRKGNTSLLTLFGWSTSCNVAKLRLEVMQL